MSNCLVKFSLGFVKSRQEVPRKSKVSFAGFVGFQSLIPAARVFPRFQIQTVRLAPRQSSELAALMSAAMPVRGRGNANENIT
jgi:hypothetical protein